MKPILHPADRATLFILTVGTMTLAVAAAWLGPREGAVIRGVAVIGV